LGVPAEAFGHIKLVPPDRDPWSAIEGEPHVGAIIVPEINVVVAERKYFGLHDVWEIGTSSFDFPSQLVPQGMISTGVCVPHPHRIPERQCSDINRVVGVGLWHRPSIGQEKIFIILQPLPDQSSRHTGTREVINDTPKHVIMVVAPACDAVGPCYPGNHPVMRTIVQSTRVFRTIVSCG